MKSSGDVIVWAGDAPLDTYDWIFAQRFDNADNMSIEKLNL